MPFAVAEQESRLTRPGPLARLGERLALSWAFALLAVRYWLTVFPATAIEIRRLRTHAAAIGDPAYRRLALAALDERGNIEGAAAFAALVPLSSRANATRALVAFQSLYNYADTLAEQPCPECQRAAGRVHAAMLLALCVRADPAPPDAGLQDAPDRDYVLAQLQRCRSALATLPSIDRVIAPALLAATDIWSFQTHSSRPSASFESWARSRRPPTSALSWWESAAAAGSSLPVYALIAAAGLRRLDGHTVERLLAAYCGPIGALHSLLDSLIDESEDARIGQVSLIGLYPSRPDAASAMGGLARSARAAARECPDGRRHTVLLAAMASLYLSDAEARTTRAAPVAASVRAGIGVIATPSLAVFALRRLLSRNPARAKSDAPGSSTERVEPEQPASVCARVG